MDSAPQSLPEWEAYVDSLSREQLRSAVINANTQRFVKILREEGMPLSEIENIMRVFVRKMAEVEMRVPEGGAFDLQALSDEDLLAQAYRHPSV